MAPLIVIGYKIQHKNTRIVSLAYKKQLIISIEIH